MDAPLSKHSPLSRGDFYRIALLLGCALALRGFVIANTEVAARDSIGFIRFALQFESPPAATANPDQQLTRTEVLQQAVHPPGYGWAVLLVSQPIRALLGTTPESMTLSCQIASLLATLYLIVPFYALARRWFTTNEATVATGLFLFLPAFVSISSDGLSESLYLAMLFSGLWFAARAVEGGTWLDALVAGGFSGAAYLTRPEGLMLLGSTGLILLLQIPRRGVRTVFASCVLLVVGAALVGGPYAYTIGRLTNKTTGNDVLKMLQGEQQDPSWKPKPLPVENGRAPNVNPGVNVPLAAWWHPEINKGDNRFVWACQALAAETLKSSFYIVSLLGLLGMLAVGRGLIEVPSLRLLTLLGCVNTLLLWYLAYRVGYVSERHTMLVVAISALFAGRGLTQVAEEMKRWRPYRNRSYGFCFWGSFALLVAIFLPPSFRSMHANRAGHHRAGNWLAEHARPTEGVWDPFSWAEFYAGRSMLPDNLKCHPNSQTFYVVWEPGDNHHSRLPKNGPARFMIRYGEPVFQYPEDVAPDKAKVVVYKVPPIPVAIPTE